MIAFHVAAVSYITEKEIILCLFSDTGHGSDKLSKTEGFHTTHFKCSPFQKYFG